MIKQECINSLLFLYETNNVNEDELNKMVDGIFNEFETKIKVDLSERILHKLLEGKLINSSIQWEPIRNIIFEEWK
jgi:hypothetical protein